MMWMHTQQHVLSNSKNSRQRLRNESVGSFDNNTASLATNPLSDDDDDEDDDHYGENFPPAFYEASPRGDLKERVMEAIQETLGELVDMHKVINDQALNYIHADEIILCYGYSQTIALFLNTAAAKSRSFHLVVAEDAPHFSGRAMARAVASGPNTHVTVTLVHDAAVFAVMARVHKVLLPAHAVLANGGLVSTAGTHTVARAAKHHSVPVVCVTGMFKLCPTYPHEGQDTMNELVGPAGVVNEMRMRGMVSTGYDDDYDNSELEGERDKVEELWNNDFYDQVEFVNPVHDYIPPELIKLYVTNIGGFQPSYIYRLLAEYYHTDDWLSFE